METKIITEEELKKEKVRGQGRKLNQGNKFTKKIVKNVTRDGGKERRGR